MYKLPPAQILASILIQLMQNRGGLPIEWIKSAYGLDDRTYRNYRMRLQTLPELLDKNGKPFVIEEKDGETRYLKLGDIALDADKTAMSFAAFYMASSLMNFLGGTNLYEPFDKWGKRLKENGVSLPVNHIEKKIYSISEWAKDYSGKHEIVRKVITGVTSQRKMNIRYKPKYADHKTWHNNFKGYTLAQYRYGLYLVGLSEERGKEIIQLAVENIENVELAKETFHYPKDYSPRDHFKDAFGIIRGDKKQVVELLFDPSTSGIKERIFHSTARIKEEKDGYIRYTMTVSSLDQVVYWVLGYGSLVEVIGPPELKEMVVKEIALMSRQYRKK